MSAPKRFIQIITAVLPLASLLALPLAPTMAQRPAQGAAPPAGRTSVISI